MYDNAKRALKIFWDNSKNKLPFDSYEAMIEYYRTDFDVTDVLGNPLKHDDFFEMYNKAVGYVDWSEVRDAMKDLASSLPKGKIPSSSSFFDALSEQVSSFTFHDVKNIAVNTVEDIKDTATTVAVGGASLWLLKTIGAFILFQLLSKK
tara:strand:+ start:28589 stop:29035 length:447 start_codon:yes stop_codon:yes gene_type:complete